MERFDFLASKTKNLLYAVSRTGVTGTNGISADLEKYLTKKDVINATECFVTGTAAEIVPVRSVDKITVGEGKRGPITKVVQAAYYILLNLTQF